MKKSTLISEIVILIVILFIFYSQILLTSGNLLSGDLTFPIYLENFIRVFIWNDQVGWNMAEYISRLPYNLPFIIAGKVLGLGISSVTKLILFFTAILSVISFLFLSIYILKDLKFDENTVAVASLIGSIIYGINIWTIMKIGHIYYLPTYAIFPIIIRVLIRSSKDRKRYIENSLIIGTLLAFFGISPNGIFWIMSIIIIWLFCDTFFPIFDYQRLKHNVKFFMLVSVFFLFIGSYFIIPMFVSSFYGEAAPSPSYMMSWEVLDMLSRNSEWDNVIRLMSSWWPIGNYSPDFFGNLWKIASFILPVMAICSLLLNRNKYTVYFSILAFIFILLSVGTKSFISEMIYEKLFNFFGQFTWILRDPSKNLSLIILPYSILIAIVISEILIRIKKIFALVAISIFLILYLFSIYPTVDNYMFDFYIPDKVPPEYFNINTWLENQNEDFKVLWLSSWTYGKIENGMYKFSWNKKRPVSSKITIESSKKPSFDRDRINNFNLYSKYIKELLSKNSDIRKFLQPLSIKYILYTNDGLMGEREGLRDIRYLNKYLNKSINYDFIYAFENPVFSPEVNIVDNVAVLGGINVYDSLNTIDSFNSTKFSLFFLDQSVNKDTYKIVNNSNVIIFNDLNNRLFDLNDALIIKPIDSTIHHKPLEFWSKAMTNDPVHGEWHPYLSERNIKNWDFDYSKGIVFTQATQGIEKEIDPMKEDLLASYNFEKDFKYWTADAKSSIVKLDNISYQGKYSLLSMTNKSSSYWKTINSPLISTNYQIPYRFIFYIKSIDSYKIHAKIAEYDSNRNFIDMSYISSIDTVALDWKKVSFDYYPKDKKVSYLQLQIWHDYNTNKKLTNKIWIDDVNIYNLSRYIIPVSIDMDVDIKKDDYYELFIRYFKNKDGGKINISLDGKTSIINTRDPLNKFVWKKVTSMNLSKGKNRLSLSNSDGFNSVNIFALIPKKNYQNMENNIQSMIKDKRVIYIKEAESDLYLKEISTSKENGGRSESDKVVEFSNASRSWQNIDIIRSDNYKMAFKINGSFSIKIDNNKFNMSSNGSDFVYIGPIFLNKGNHKIDLKKFGKDEYSYLDVIWIFNTSNLSATISGNKSKVVEDYRKEQLEDIFNLENVSATISNYKKINPTLYKVKVNASKPFMISFAESYDPLWKLKIDKINGKSADSEKIRSVPLYSVINGFWINQTGDIDITIEYEPQKWFYLGAVISITSLFICAGYLVHDWRKRKSKQK